jgi:hypothetical protein
MTNWQTNKPDSPGIWWWCDGVSDEVKEYLAWKGMHGSYIAMIGKNGTTGVSHELHNAPDGYWLKQPTPPAFFAPKPPTLEWDEIWEAEYIWLHVDDKRRWLYKRGIRFVSCDVDGNPQATGDWGDAKNNYKLIRKVSP